MSTMKEMALEYRKAAVQLSLHIRERKSAGAGKEELTQLHAALRNIREVQRVLDGYYDVPRPEGITSTGWRARGPTEDDH